jgi:competence protein ComEC
MNFYSRAPLARLLFPFLIGIIACIVFPAAIPPHYSFLLFVGLIPIALAYFFNSYRLKNAYGYVLNIWLFAAGYYITSTHNYTKLIPENSPSVYIGELIEPLKEKEKVYKGIVRIKGTAEGENIKSFSGNVLIYIEKPIDTGVPELYDQIIFRSKLQEVPGPSNPHEFNYKKYLSFRGINHQGFIKKDQLEIVSEYSGNSVFSMARKAAEKMLSALKATGLEGKDLAVASALVLGYKDDLDPGVIKAYSGAGAMHVLAVSGLHVGIVYLVLDFILKFLNHRKVIILKYILLILALWSFALITGMSPSVMRAATMFTFVIGGKMLQRGSSIYNSIAASAFLLLLINPFLITEVGFQLSYLAVLGIIYLQPKIYNLMEFKNNFADKVWALSAVSLAAQLATFPLGLLYFHQFPNYFLLSNLIVIPGATLVLYGGISAIFLNYLSEIINVLQPVFNVFSYIYNLLLKTLNFLVFEIEKLPFSITNDVYISSFQTISIYLSIFSLLVYMAIPKVKYLNAGLLFVILFLVSAADFNGISKNKIFVYNIKGHTALNLIIGKENVLLTDLPAEIADQKIQFHIRGNRIAQGVKKEEILPIPEGVPVVLPNNKLLMVLPNDYESLPEKEEKLKLDYLIITGKSRWSNLEDYSKYFEINRVIIDSSVQGNKTEKIKQKLSELNLNYYAVVESGAFAEEL